MWWFVDGEAVDTATWTEAAVRRVQHTTAVCTVQLEAQRVAARCKARESALDDGCGVVACGEQ